MEEDCGLIFVEEIRMKKNKRLRNMKKITSYIGLGLLGVALTSFTKVQECNPKIENLKVGDIAVIELEEEIDLGFNTAQYLPIGFNPYKGMKLDLDDIVIIGEEQEIQLGFDTAQYLPVGFNACEGMEVKRDDLDFLKGKEKIFLEFNDEEYLPEDLNSHSK